MDCGVEGPSKPNFMAVKLTDDDDDFFIDDLLDFPTDAAFLEENDNSHTNNHKTSPVSPLNEDKTTIPDTELCLPVNDVDDLEWVSHFVDDSFYGDYSLTFPARKFPETETETVTLVSVNPSFKNLVHKRARSKRSRNGGSIWSLPSSSPFPDSSTSSSSASSCTSNPTEKILGKATVQMQKKKSPAAAMGSGQLQPRRCSHCLVQKTPQWRAGPLGAKTLCNACGVRFKSGRLLPEYRPACSPTFSSEVHSNNHRKVLEMRRKKAEAGGGLTVLEFEDGSERTW
ncbi:hypothetical protein L1987_34135 [Smallanthus sonchifolius]|uniref:Uncharacterized protein n=1 Tax=Smallanthus sonchifolius TaxID=185202 RepID=A0ACB9HUH6_9ASTR|nr:hypothetical protein L1987_34135 [Smallanthus sonchifolius]